MKSKLLLAIVSFTLFFSLMGTIEAESIQLKMIRVLILKTRWFFPWTVPWH